MAITLFQETIPFSNKKTDQPVSSNGAYLNPVIMSFAFDFTVCTNILETVLYLRNDDVNKYYKNVVVTLHKRDLNNITPASQVGIIKETLELGPHIAIGASEPVPCTVSVEQYTTIPVAGLAITGQYLDDSIPITDYRKQDGTLISTDDNIDVRFSYGYDELSNVEWAEKKPGLIIPWVGNQQTPDTSYLPVRMRMLWKAPASLFTIRDYFIDVSYEKEQYIGMAMV